MTLSNFTSIGKAVLIRATGLQKNYIEEVVSVKEELDIEGTGCYECDNYQLKEIYKSLPNSEEYINCNKKCNHCPCTKYRHVYKTTKKYHNEKNRFGYQPRLKKLPLLVFIAYHFMSVDKNGIIKNVSVDELAELLNCDVRSIKLANEKLVEYGYIITSNGIEPNKYINVLLKEYKQYFAPAIEGGRGYYVCSKEILNELITYKDINTMRFAIRFLIQHDDKSISNDYDGSITKSYKEMRNYLPDYCKRNVMIKALEKLNTLFNVQVGSYNATLELFHDFQSKKNKSDYLINNEINIKANLEEFNNILDDHEKLEYNYPDFVIPGVVSYSPIHLDNKDLHDLVSMSVQYSIPIVFDALANVYRNYINKSIHIENFGGLIRSTIKKSMKNSYSSYVAA